MAIFRDFAPAYWNAGLPVMPLKQWNSIGKGAGKAPILAEWTQYGEYMPAEAMRTLWLQQYGESNIGLPFGIASGLCAIDIDTEDDELVKVILAALPPSPWRRIGKKGMGLIYKWQGQPNFKLRDGQNQSIVEFLGKGNQLVMPPSIHPDTGKPYVSDTNLWEVIDKIIPLPLDVERILRQALNGVEGLSIAQTSRSAPLDVVPQGERDIQMVRHAGYLARVVLGIDKNTTFTLAEAMKHMRHWVENFTSRTSGDDMDPDKGVNKLIEFLLKDIDGGRTMPNGWDTGLSEDQLKHPAIADMIEKNKIQRWTVVKANFWLEEQISQKPDDRNWVMEKVQELIGLLARDENFSEFEMKSLIPDLQALAKPMKLSRPDLTKLFKQLRAGDGEQAADQEGIARQVLEELNRGGELRFDQSTFWQWNGSCFDGKDEVEIQKYVAENVKGNLLSRRQSDYVAIAKTIAMVSRAPLAEQLEDGINFANGFLDANLVLHDHSPKYGKTFTMPFDYVEGRAFEAYKWLEYLERSWGDDEDYTEKVMALQEAFAATMFGMAPQFQRAFLLHGKAGSGKTQALEVLRAMMPTSAQSSVPPSVWGERFQLTPMVGKTLNICGELPEEAVINGDTFKQIVEGSSHNTEYKGTAIFEFKPIAAQWFASNFLPRSRDSSKGFVRRWQIFDFNRVVPLAEKVVNFHQVMIAEEREAIAAWAVQGLKRLMQQKDYTQPLSHTRRLDQVARANNSVAAFLQSNDKARPTDGYKADLQNVFDYYCEFMKVVSRGYPVSFERFRQMLEELDHPCVPYQDALGVMKYEVEGVQLISAHLPVKPR